MKDAAWLDPKNFYEIDKNGFPNAALKSIASIANVERELLSQEFESFSKSFNEFFKTISDEHVPSRQQHTNDSDSHREEEDEEQEEIGEDGLDQTAKNAICWSRRGSDACRRCISCACKILSQYNMTSVRSPAYSRLLCNPHNVVYASNLLKTIFRAEAH